MTVMVVGYLILTGIDFFDFFSVFYFVVVLLY